MGGVAGSALEGGRGFDGREGGGAARGGAGGGGGI